MQACDVPCINARVPGPISIWHDRHVRIFLHDAAAGCIQSSMLDSRRKALEQWDEDEAMQDMEGQAADEMTRQLISFRLPGNTLHQYVSA